MTGNHPVYEAEANLSQLEVLITREQLKERIQELGREITKDYTKKSFIWWESSREASSSLPIWSGNSS